MKRIFSMILACATVLTLFAGLLPAQTVEAASYTPNRTIKLTTETGAGSRKITLEKLSDKVGVGKSVTVAGYYKIENYTNTSGGVGYAYSYLGADTYNDSSADRANTNGWVRFEFKIASTTADSASWVQFGFAGTANGTITLADVTVSDGSKILYSMAMDASLVAGTYTGTKQSGIWYFSGSSTVVSAVSNEPYMRDIVLPNTSLINPPTVVQIVNTTAKFNALKNASRPQAAWMKVNTDKTISLGSTKISIYDALNGCKARVIPIFEVSDTATAEYVVKSINNLTYGVIIASHSAAAIKKAASYRAPHVTFAYIPSSTDVKTIARETLNCGAHTCVVSSASREQMEYLQKRFLTVMLKRTDGANDEHCVRAAFDNGANFVVMDGFQTAYDMYAKIKKVTYVRRPFVVGHRGMVTNAPENTVEGIREAFNNGADAAEIDIWHTSDKQIVCFHNTTLEGAMTTTTPTKNIPDYTLSELKSYTLKTVGKYSGLKIPTLGEMFTELKKHPDKILVIEIKTWQSIDDLLQAEIDKYGVADQCVIIAFSETQIDLHRDQIPYVGRSQLEITANLTGTSYDCDLELAAHAHYRVSDSGAMYSPGYEYSAGAVRYLHAHGITCNMWTATDYTMMKRLADAGAQFVTTDDVASANRLRSSLNALGAQAIFGNPTTNPPSTTKPTTATTKPTTTTTKPTSATTKVTTTAKPTTTAVPTTPKPTTIPTTVPTTAPTTRPTSAPTTRPTTAPTTVQTTPPTTIQTTPPTTVAPKPTTQPTTIPTQGDHNPCLNGHTFTNGFCVYCATPDPNYSPCANGHTFKNGFCIYCAEHDPNYDPCAKGHSYKNGHCIYCLAKDPNYNPCAKGHTFKNGYCIYCLVRDPDYTLCGNGHTFENGHCIYCAQPDPNYDPCANGHTYQNGFCVDCLMPEPAQPTTQPTTQPPVSNSENNQESDMTTIILIGFIVVMVVGLSAMLIVLFKKKK